jgi:hypothetical protein
MPLAISMAVLPFSTCLTDLSGNVIFIIINLIEKLGAKIPKITETFIEVGLRVNFIFSDSLQIG